MFFYDSDTIQQDFGTYGHLEISEVDDPNKEKKDKPSIPFLMIKCKNNKDSGNV